METAQLNRFDRIVAMLVHLQSRRVVRAQELADRFQVSLRTVYRDIRSLELSGVPITGEAGIGYSLVEGYKLPPIMFSPEEAGSFVAAEKLMLRFCDKTLGSHYQSAMYKIKSVLKSNQKERIELLENQIWVESGQQLFNEHTPDALEILLDSIAGRRQVRMTYRAYESDVSLERLIEPIGVFHEHQFWYVMAFCHLRSDYRQFRTDRMFGIDRTDLPFSREHGSLEDHRHTDPRPATRKVVISVDRKISRWLQNSKKYYGFLSESVNAERVEMTFMIDDSCDSFCRWYLTFADKAEIIEPDSLREDVAVLLEKIRESLAVGV